MEHRWGERLPVHVPVRLKRPPGLIGWGVLKDVSLTGAFIESALPLPPLSYIHVELLNTPGTRQRFAALVVRRTREGAGLEWCEPFATGATLLTRFGAVHTEPATVVHSIRAAR